MKPANALLIVAAIAVLIAVLYAVSNSTGPVENISQSFDDGMQELRDEGDDTP